LSDEQRLDAMLNFSKYNPVDTYYFPTKVEYEKTPIFSAQLSIKSFPWLGYSAKFDVCLCLPCALFSSRSHSKYFVQKVYSHLTKLNEEGHFLKKITSMWI